MLLHKHHMKRHKAMTVGVLPATQLYVAGDLSTIKKVREIVNHEVEKWSDVVSERF